MTLIRTLVLIVFHESPQDMPLSSMPGVNTCNMKKNAIHSPNVCTTHPRCYVMQVVCVAHKRCVARYLEIPNKQTLICQINLFCKLMLKLRWGENDVLEVETWATRGGGERTSAGLWICCTPQYLTVLTVFSCFGQMTWTQIDFMY